MARVRLTLKTYCIAKPFKAIDYLYWTHYSE
jgi:hypothetical protein